MADLPGADDLGVELVPEADPGITPDEELRKAIQSVSAPTGSDIEEAPEPFGKTWLFDINAGRFVRTGLAPVEQHDEDSLIMWIQMAIHVAKGAHPCFSTDFGMDDPENVFGALLSSEVVADYTKRLQEALLQHDRITGTENMKASYDPTTGVLLIESLEVHTDDEGVLAIGDFRIGVED